MDASTETTMAVVMLIIVGGLIALSFFSAILYSSVSGTSQVNDSEHAANLGKAAAAIAAHGLKRKLKRVLFRSLV
jgi:hypothetical protein